MTSMDLFRYAATKIRWDIVIANFYGRRMLFKSLLDLNTWIICLKKAFLNITINIKLEMLLRTTRWVNKSKFLLNFLFIHQLSCWVDDLHVKGILKSQLKSGALTVGPQPPLCPTIHVNVLHNADKTGFRSNDRNSQIDNVCDRKWLQRD